MNKGCPKCGRMIEQNYEKCPYCSFNFNEIDNFFRKIEQEKKEDEKYAGFIKRIVSGMIDIYISLLITCPIFVKLKGNINNDNLSILLLFTFVIYIIYNSVLERTKMKGSIGKYITKIEVTDEYENPITLNKAFIRNFSKIFNILTLGIGFLTCASLPHKQTLGDKISETYVLNKVILKEEKEVDTASIFKRILAFIIDTLYIITIILVTKYILNYVSNINIIKEIVIKYKTIINQTFTLLLVLLYFPLNEKNNGQTIGKKILKIKVEGTNEETISFLKALIRYILIIIDIITFGYLLIFTSKKKQTLKDVITKTVVINN